MAIGHSGGAFASVEAPKVDFGEIALNAQKFNEADIERQEAKKAAEAKARAAAKEFDWKVPGSEKSSGIESFEISTRDTLNKGVNEVANIMEIAQSSGGFNSLPARVQVKYHSLQNLGKQIDADKTVVLTNYTKYKDNMDKYSGAGNSQVDVVGAVASGKVISELSEDGTVRYKPLKLKEDGSVSRKEDGSVEYGTFTDKFGNEKEYVTNEDLKSGGLFNMPLAFDQLGFSKKVAEHIAPYTKGTDTGITAVKNISLTDQNRQSISTLIDSELNNRDSLIDVLYKLNPEVYGKPRKEYTKEDKNLAKEGLEKAILGGIQLSNVTTVDNAERNRQKEEDKYKYTLARVPFEVVGKSVSPDVKKGSDGLVVINGARPTNTNLTAYDLKGNRINIPYGSVLTGLTKGTGGGALSRVTIIEYKSARDASEAKNAFEQLGPNPTEEDVQALARSYGASSRSEWLRTPEAVTNMLLAAGKGNIKSYKQALPLITVKDWKNPIKKTKDKKENKKGILD
jgi:hypothetical protein